MGRLRAAFPFQRPGASDVCERLRRLERLFGIGRSPQLRHPRILPCRGPTATRGSGFLEAGSRGCAWCAFSFSSRRSTPSARRSTVRTGRPLSRRKFRSGRAWPWAAQLQPRNIISSRWLPPFLLPLLLPNCQGQAGTGRHINAPAPLKHQF
jgi:hypothetical protein